MCVLTGMVGQDCPDSRAGVYKVFAISTKKIASVTWGTDHEVTAITLETPGTDVWVEIDPSKDTAFFTQPFTKVKNSKNYVQTLSFDRDGVSVDDYLAVEQLSDCCSVTFAVVGNDNNIRLMGIEYTDGTGFKDIQFKATAGFANSGTDPASESSARQLVFSANSGKEAPLTTLAIAGFPTS